MVFFVLAMTGLTVGVSIRDFGWKRILLVSTMVLLISGIAVMVNLKLGYPFGQLIYTGRLGFRIGGVMPWIIPFFWLLLVLNAYILSSGILISWYDPRSNDFQISLIFLAAIVATLMEACWEPMAMNIKQYCFWLDRDRIYYGLPRLNFFGWLVLSMLLSGMLGWVLDPKRLRLSTAWMSWILFGVMAMFLALLNWHAHQYLPVMISLNLIGFLAIGLLARIES